MKGPVLKLFCAAIVLVFASSAADAVQKNPRKHSKQPITAFARMGGPGGFAATSPAANADAQRYYNKLSAPAGH